MIYKLVYKLKKEKTGKIEKGLLFFSYYMKN